MSKTKAKDMQGCTKGMAGRAHALGATWMGAKKLSSQSISVERVETENDTIQYKIALWN